MYTLFVLIYVEKKLPPLYFLQINVSYVSQFLPLPVKKAVVLVDYYMAACLSAAAAVESHCKALKWLSVGKYSQSCGRENLLVLSASNHHKGLLAF